MKVYAKGQTIPYEVVDAGELEALLELSIADCRLPIGATAEGDS